MSGSPTLSQVRAQVASVREKFPEARVIGIRVPDPSWTGDALRVGSESLPVASCRSVLELRERLVGQLEDGPPLVVLTNLQSAELGTDVLARLARRQLFSINLWQLVKDRFRARWVDPRLVQRHEWVAPALLEAEPEHGYTPAPSGFVEAEMAWRHLCEALLRLPGGKRDPETLLAWALDPTSRERLMALSDKFLEGLVQAVAESAGELAGVILRSVTRQGRRALAVGLVARILFSPETRREEKAAKARGKLEALLDLGELHPELAGAWASAAEAVLQRRLERPGDPVPALRPVLAEADALLRELGAEDLAWRSTSLQSGYQQRLERLARELTGFAEGSEGRVPDALREAAEAVLSHQLVAYERARMEGLEMAMRLAGWLAARRTTTVSMGASFSNAAQAYRAEGGFADWARTRVWDGDPSKALAEAYARLASQCDAQREAENRQFASLFAGWIASGSHDKPLLPVEKVLESVLVPLAKACPVLLVVIDAMGMAVFRELEQDLLRGGWIELVPDDEVIRPPVIAVVPTVTEVSRTSLLCGKLLTGNSATEKEGFSQHRGLVAASEPVAPPVLFHKGNLRETGAAGVAPTVLEEVSDLHRRVVGVVINAVDDHLAKGDQVRVPWTVHHIRPLEELLEVAQAAGRIVVFVSDHGHVLERASESREGEGSERWRAATRAPEADEVLLAGPRVIAAGGRLLAPWSERVRFGIKKNGYHGGAAPQEVVIPLAVMAMPDVAANLSDWREVAPEIPSWWDWRREPEASVAEPARPVRRPLPRKGKTGNLFAQPVETAAVVRPGMEWVTRLLESELFQSQRERAARTALSGDRIRTILTALDERGGKLTCAALAGRLGVAPLRLGGILSALRRLLNVEGYDVLAVDEASDTVELNRELLDAQFGLEAMRKPGRASR